MSKSQTIAQTTLLKKKLLALAQKSKVLTEKQKKTIALLHKHRQVLKATKIKLLKYQKAYLKQKEQLQSQTSDLAQMEALKAGTQHLEADLKKAQARISKTLTLLKESKAQTKDAKQKLRLISQSQENFEASLYTLSQRDQELANLKASLSSIRDEARLSAEEIAERDTEIATLQARISSLGQTSAQLEKDATQAKAQYDDKLLTFQRNTEELQDKLLVESEQTQRALDKLTQSEQKLSEIQTKLTEAELALETERAQSLRSSQDALDKLAQTEQELSELQAKLAEVETTLETERAQSLRSSQDALDKLTQTEKKLSELQIKLADAELTPSPTQSDQTPSPPSSVPKQRLDEARREISSLEDQLQAQALAFSTLDQSHKKTTNLLREREQEHEDTLLKLWELEERLKEQSEISEPSPLHHAELQTELQALEAENATLTELLSAAEAERNEAQARLNENLQAQTEATLQNPSLNLQAELESRIQALTQELQAERDKASSQALKDPAGTRAAKAESRLQQIEEQLVDTRSRLLDSHNELEQLEQAKMAATTKLTAVEKDLEFRGSQIQQLENLVALLEQKEETFDRQLQALRRQIAELIDENGKLKADAQTQTAQQAQTQRTLTDTEEKLSHLRRRYDNTVTAFEKAKEELTDTRTRALQNMARADEYEQKSVEAEHKLSSATEDLKSFKRKVERLQERLVELETMS